MPNSIYDNCDPTLHAILFDMIHKARVDQDATARHLADAELSEIRDRMSKSPVKSLSGSYLHALGLGRPEKQGGRAKAVR